MALLTGTLSWFQLISLMRAAHHQDAGLQVWVGRLAMMGFTTSIIEEAITKKGTLGQIGLITPSPPLFITISGAATVGTFVALAVTFYNASTGKMTARQVIKKWRC